jgi:hypothetical protein
VNFLSSSRAYYAESIINNDFRESGDPEQFRGHEQETKARGLDDEVPEPSVIASWIVRPIIIALSSRSRVQYNDGSRSKKYLVNKSDHVYHLVTILRK